MYWNLTKEGIPYLQIDSIPLIAPPSPPMSDEHKRVFKEFFQQIKGKVEIVGGVPFTLKIKK